jgi:hypothetical protein
MPLEWRHGDLVTLRLREKIDTVRPECPPETIWSEVKIGSVRVRIRPADGDPDATLDPRLRQVVPGDILDTVSRRDPRRSDVAMWTSGNRVFGTRSPHALHAVVRSLACGGDPDATIEEMLGRRLARIEWCNIRCAGAQIFDVIDAERAELVGMGWAA